MLITTTTDFDSNNICEFIFGDNTGFSNKISYQMNGKITDNAISIPFDSDIFKDILNSNKDQDSGTLKLSKTGVLKLNFMSDDIKSKLESLDEVNQAFVEVTFDPPWTPEMITDEAKEKLRHRR